MKQKKYRLLLSLILTMSLVIVLDDLVGAFSTQWSHDFNYNTGTNPNLPEFSEYLIGAGCGTGQNHSVNNSLIMDVNGTGTDCFGAYYRDNSNFPGTFPTDKDVRVTWRYMYNSLKWMGTEAGQITGSMGSPQYYGLSGVDNDDYNKYHVESNGPWGSWNVSKPMWASSTEDVWRRATFDFICDGKNMYWWMGTTMFYAEENGPVLAPNDPSRPYQIWFGNLLVSGGKGNSWTEFEADDIHV